MHSAIRNRSLFPLLLDSAIYILNQHLCITLIQIVEYNYLDVTKQFLRKQYVAFERLSLESVNPL